MSDDLVVGDVISSVLWNDMPLTVLIIDGPWVELGTSASNGTDPFSTYIFGGSEVLKKVDITFIRANCYPRIKVPR